MSGHTPGPWTCDSGEPADYSVGLDGSPAGIYAARPNAEEPDDDPILLFVPREPLYSAQNFAHLPGDDPMDCYLERYHGSMSANMSLCAAAPDLLDLIRRLRQWDHLDGAGDGAYWKSEIDAAIAKATGT